MSKLLGNLFIISAPSGAGKTSLVNEVVKRVNGIMVSISHTTRPMRPQEQDGVNYHFISREQFKKMKSEGVFIEDAEVFDNFYGTSKHWVEEKLAAGIDVILEIDWQGAQQICKIMSNAVKIFVLPPSQLVLRQRLESREQDSKEVIDKRMSLAKSEISHYGEYEYLVINDDFNLALHQLKAIIEANRLKTPKQELANRDLLDKYLL